MIYIISCLTDFLDGFIARKFNLTSPFGAFLDPVADKVRERKRESGEIIAAVRSSVFPAEKQWLYFSPLTTSSLQLTKINFIFLYSLW